MDFSQTPGMQQMNDAHLSALPTAGKTCNIKLGDGTSKKEGEKTVYFQNGQPCLLTAYNGKKSEPECGDKLMKDIDSSGDDKAKTVRSSLTSDTDSKLKDDAQPKIMLKYGKDESGNMALFLYGVQKDGSIDKSHYVRLVQYKDPNRKDDCDIQTYGPNGQVGDFIETSTTPTGAQSSGGLACPAKEGKIAMFGSSSLNYTSGQILSATNDTKARVGDMNGSGFNTSHYATASK